MLVKSSKQLRIWLVLVGLALLNSAASAVHASAMYRETVPVENQEQKARRQAASEGLGIVLVRLSGTRRVMNNAQVRQALGQADRYLEQFSYRRAEGEGEDTDAGADAETYELVMDFQPEPVTDLLRAAGLPVWSGKRPPVLAWVEVNDGASRRIVTSGAPDWSERVMEEARRRGLPLRLPSSTAGAGATDVAQNMGVSLILRGFLRLQGDSCSSQWTMEIEGEVEQWSFNTADHDQCVARGVDAAAEALSAQFAFSAGASSGEAVKIEVAGIRSFEDYTRVILMLEQLAVTESVNVNTALSDRVTFSLLLQGGVDQLQRALRQERILNESEPPPTVSGASDSPSSTAGDAAGSDVAGYPVSTTAPTELQVPSPTLYYRLSSG